MKPETACEKNMNETFVQIIHLLNNSERTVDSFDCIVLEHFGRFEGRCVTKKHAIKNAFLEKILKVSCENLPKNPICI